MQLPFVTTPIQLRFSDVDMLGHVSNSLYPRYFDLGRIDFYTAIDDSEPKPVSVVRTVSYEMFHEVRLEDKPELLTWCREIDGKRMYIAHELYVGSKLCCSGDVLSLGFDPKTRKTCSFPAHWAPSAEPPRP